MFNVQLSFVHRKRIDARTRKDRIQQHVNAWQRQIPLLADQFLKWKEAGGRGDGLSEMQMEPAWEMDTISFSGT
jgi:hypothetical protein